MFVKNFKLKNTIIAVLIIFLISSCSSKKNIIYLQDLSQNDNFNVVFNSYRLKIDDVLKIDISSDLAEPLSVLNRNSQNFSSNNTLQSFLYNGYQIDTDGYINYPSLGKIYAKGKTLEEFTKIIENKIIINEILLEPTVDIKILNTHFTILGEVKSPGRYEYLKNNINLLEAIGMAGDLTINGKRNDIKIIRNISDDGRVIEIDLTKTNFIEKEGFQIVSGDIIIVSPNFSKVKNAGIIGNSGTLISLLSFILSSIIVINNAN